MPLIPNEEFEKNALSSILAIALKVVVEVPVGVAEAVPVTEGLVNTFMRQFAVAITWVKPTSPQLSGGVYGDSLPLTLAYEPHIVRKLLVTTCVGAEVAVVL